MSPYQIGAEYGGPWVDLDAVQLVWPAQRDEDRPSWFRFNFRLAFQNEPSTVEVFMPEWPSLTWAAAYASIYTPFIEAWKARGAA